MAETPRAEASSKDRSSGLRARACSAATACVAKAPEHQPRTASPGWKRLTPAPTASTTPAMSVPGTGTLGRRSPYMGRKSLGTPRMMWQSPMCTEAAWMRTSTWPIAGAGVSTSRSWQDLLEGTVAVLDDGLHRDSPSLLG